VAGQYRSAAISGNTNLTSDHQFELFAARHAITALGQSVPQADSIQDYQAFEALRKFRRKAAGQSHLDFELPAGAVLKGHGFSRAIAWREQRVGFSRGGMFWGMKIHPSGSKGQKYPLEVHAARLKRLRKKGECLEK